MLLSFGYQSLVAWELQARQDTIEIDNCLLVGEYIHLFSFFGDSSVTFSYAAQDTWYQVTNASDSLFRYTETDGFTVLGDTITVSHTGDYDFRSQLTLDGGNGETISMRFFNVTQTAGIPTASALTTRGSGSFGTIHVEGYASVTAGDKIILQIKNDDASPSNSVLKNGVTKVYYIHE